MIWLPISVLILMWIAFGAWSFVFWWTHDHDFSTNEMGLLASAALFGPLAFVIGWFIHGGDGRILIARRPRRTGA